MLAAWILDYDHVTDTCYNRPGCPECQAPVGSDGICFSCQKKYELDDAMMVWLNATNEEKVEKGDCIKCGGKGTMEKHFIRNAVTLEWQTAYGHCDKCGMKFIV